MTLTTIQIAVQIFDIIWLIVLITALIIVLIKEIRNS